MSLAARDHVSAVPQRLVGNRRDPLGDAAGGDGGDGLLERDGHLLGRLEAVGGGTGKPSHDDGVELG